MQHVTHDQTGRVMIMLCTQEHCCSYHPMFNSSVLPRDTISNNLSCILTTRTTTVDRRHVKLLFCSIFQDTRHTTAPTTASPCASPTFSSPSVSPTATLSPSPSGTIASVADVATTSTQSPPRSQLHVAGGDGGSVSDLDGVSNSPPPQAVSVPVPRTNHRTSSSNQPFGARMSSTLTRHSRPAARLSSDGSQRRASEPVIVHRIAEDTRGLCEYTSSHGRCAAKATVASERSGQQGVQHLCERHACPSCGQAKASAHMLCGSCATTSHCQYVPLDRKRVCMQQHLPGRLFCANHTCPNCATGFKRTNDLACESCMAMGRAGSSDGESCWDDGPDDTLTRLPISGTRQGRIRFMSKSESSLIATTPESVCDTSQAKLKRHSSAAALQVGQAQVG